MLVCGARFVDQSQVDQIHKNVTTKAEVIRLLGKPFKNKVSPEGSKVLAYHYVPQKYHDIWEAPGSNWIFRKKNSKQKILFITLDKNGRVAKIYLEKNPHNNKHSKKHHSTRAHSSSGSSRKISPIKIH